MKILGPKFVFYLYMKLQKILIRKLIIVSSLIHLAYLNLIVYHAIAIYSTLFNLDVISEFIFEDRIGYLSDGVYFPQLVVLVNLILRDLYNESPLL